MPGLHPNGSLGILREDELDRDIAGVQGTYGWSVQSAAVTFSSGLTFAYASAAAGDYTLNSVLGAAITGSTVVLGTQDPSFPRVDRIVTTVAGAVSVVAGTPAALTATSGPVPTALTALQLELARIFVPASGTALSSASITDRRHPIPSIKGMKLVGSSTTPTSTTSTSAVDLVTISGLSIPISSWILVRFTYRKQALAAQVAAYGLKLNATVVMEAAASANAAARTSGNNAAESGFAEILIPPRETANYGYTVSRFYRTGNTSGTEVAGLNADLIATTASPGGLNAVPPQATITSVIIRAINATTSNAAEVGTVDVYEMVGS